MAEKTYIMDINEKNKTYYVQPPLARGSYMNAIHEPQGFENSEDVSWGCQLRWPMDNEEVKQWAGDMVQMFKKIIIAKWGAENADRIMKNCRLPLRNGDNEEREQYHGWLFMNVRNKFRRPIILGPTAQPLTDEMITPDYIYSGAWYRSGINFFTYDVKGKGIGAGLDVLMKIKDDERLDGGITETQATDMFSQFSDPNAGLSEASGQLDAEDTNGFDFF